MDFQGSSGKKAMMPPKKWFSHKGVFAASLSQKNIKTKNTKIWSQQPTLTGWRWGKPNAWIQGPGTLSGNYFFYISCTRAHFTPTLPYFPIFPTHIFIMNFCASLISTLQRFFTNSPAIAIFLSTVLVSALKYFGGEIEIGTILALCQQLGCARIHSWTVCGNFIIIIIITTIIMTIIKIIINTIIITTTIIIIIMVLRSD